MFNTHAQLSIIITNALQFHLIYLFAYRDTN